MDDIIKYDVRTYVEELIKKEFCPITTKKERGLSENGKTKADTPKTMENRKWSSIQK